MLTPEQVQEYELRSSDIANNMRWQLGPFDSNEQEFRAIFNYKQAQEDLNPPRNPDDEGKHPSAEEMKARQEKQKELDAALASALGPERLKEYKLMDQWEYRNLFGRFANTATAQSESAPPRRLSPDLVTRRGLDWL